MRCSDDRGAVTVEAALALCSLTVVLALALGAVAAAGAQMRCLDAAREGARLVARGEPERARTAAATIAPTGASFDVRTAGDEVTVRVSSRLVGPLPGLTVSGLAVGVLEPGQLGSSSASGTDPGGVADATDGDSDGAGSDGAGSGGAGQRDGPPAVDGQER
ncbi:MAG TPA: TadE family type IV pilus minor pilin [Pseudonocardia sp.]|jgi:hypothetical protein|uniref:TadE family type IV pilus minor pilin n=1 Tax=Pseudonocardia sp. TaxID=60912 RepID=UPI002F3EA0AA